MPNSFKKQIDEKTEELKRVKPANREAKQKRLDWLKRDLKNVLRKRKARELELSRLPERPKVWARGRRLYMN